MIKRPTQSATSISTYGHCSFQYFLKYVLNMEIRVGKAAVLGSIQHKVLDWMAKIRKLDKTPRDPFILLDKSWNFYERQNPDIGLRKYTTKGESSDFTKTTNNLITVINSCYNPYKIKRILDSEKYFEINIPFYDDNAFKVIGYIDLIYSIDNDTIEIIDWKSGKRQEICFDNLTQNIQARLYHLACYYLYPQYRNVITTFFYMESGPITISLSENDIPITLAILYQFHKLLINDCIIARNRCWKCKMCSFDKTKICDLIWNEVHTKTNTYIIQKYSGLKFEDQKEMVKQHGMEVSNL